MTPDEHRHHDEVPTAAYESPGTKRRLWQVLAALAVLAGGIWLLPRGDGSVARVHAAGVLRVGYAVQDPYAQVTPTGEVTGEAAETARMVAEQLGLARINWVQAEANDLLNGLRERRFDVVAAGLFITPEGAAQVRFSQPTLQVRPGWLTARGNPQALGPYAALRDRPGLRVGVLQGSMEQARMLALDLPETSLLVVPNTPAGLAAVLSGAVDGLALSLPTVRRLAASAPDRLEAVAPPSAEGSANAPAALAFAFHLRDAELQAAWDQAQASVIGSPRHLAMLASYGFNAEDLPAAAGGLAPADR